MSDIVMMQRAEYSKYLWVVEKTCDLADALYCGKDGAIGTRTLLPSGIKWLLRKRPCQSAKRICRYS